VPQAPSKVKYSTLARPVCRPLAGTLNHVQEYPRNNALGLLARVQLVEPQEAVWAWVGHAVAARQVAVVDVTGDVRRCRPVQVLGWVVVDVGHLMQT